MPDAPGRASKLREAVAGFASRPVYTLPNLVADDRAVVSKGLLHPQGAPIAAGLSAVGKEADGPRRNAELSGMEAANPKRATLRLAAALGGVLLTLTLGVATAAVLTLRYSDSPVAMAPISEAPTYVSAEPIASYHLPYGAITSLGEEAFVSMTSAPPTFAPPTYEPVTLPTATPTTPIAAAPQPSFPTTTVDGGATMIYNPAALGPPEDDTIPGLPTTQRLQRVAMAPTNGPLFPKTSDPDPGQRDGPSGFATTPIDEPKSSTLERKTGPTAEAIVPDTTPRDLRELAAASNETLLSYTASTKELSRRLEPEVQAGFELGKSGAVYAARAKFVEVLRKVALAKDAADGSTRCSTALADGLRKLDEADDFIPKGSALEAELDVAAIANSHGIKLASGSGPVAPHEAIAQYSQHSATRLAEAVAGEPAGSMALYGLGKSYARLEAQEGDTTAGRKSLVMYRAALDAHAQNFLAANELGVRLAQSGRYEQASRVLRVAASQPGAIATVHANLAAIEDKLGREQAAVAAQQQSQRLAQRERAAGEVSRRHGVEWVDPNAFRQATAPGMTPSTPMATAPVSQPNAQQGAAPPPGRPQQGPTLHGPRQPSAMQPYPAQQVEPSGWQSFVRAAKRATGWSKEPAVQPQPTVAPVVASQPRVYR